MYFSIVSTFSILACSAQSANASQRRSAGTIFWQVIGTSEPRKNGEKSHGYGFTHSTVGKLASDAKSNLYQARRGSGGRRRQGGGDPDAGGDRRRHQRHRGRVRRLVSVRNVSCVRCSRRAGAAWVGVGVGGGHARQYGVRTPSREPAERRDSGDA